MGVACCTFVELEDIFTLYLTNILLFNLRTQSPTPSTPSSTFRFALLMITSARLFTTRLLQADTDTYTYLHHQSSHPSHFKMGLPCSHPLRLRRLCSEDSDFLVKGGEMVSFLTRGYARAYHELLQGLRYANKSLTHS